jgi:hypothetical protein
LADRVRENLLMDGGTFIRGEGPAHLTVGFVVRAQHNDFPNEGEERLFDRARRAAEPALGHGYREILAEVRHVKDPGDGERTLDVWCEVSFEKPVGDLAAAVAEARFALALEKAATPTRGG